MTVLGPSGVDLSLCDGDLTLNAVPTRCPAWWLVSLVPAYRYGDKRGAGVVLPGASGERAYRRRRTGTDFAFRMVFGGRYNEDGDVSTEPARQLYANLLAFTTSIVADPGTATIDSVLTTPDLVTHAAPVQVLDLDPGAAELTDDDAAMRATLLIRVPRGGWLL